MSDKFIATKNRLAEQIAQSKTREDPSHAENTMQWITKLNPNADEILLLAGFGHDIERSMPDRLTGDMFDNYDDYKRSHSARAGQIAAKIARECGYSVKESERLANIIAKGEFESSDPDAQLLRDADSISFFDNNVEHYIADKGEEWAKKKMTFMYERVSERAKKYIRQIMAKKPDLDLLNIALHK